MIAHEDHVQPLFAEVASSVFVADLFPARVCDEIIAECQDCDAWTQAKIAISRKNAAGQIEIVGVVNTDRRNASRIRLADLPPQDQSKIATRIRSLQSDVGRFLTNEFGLDFNNCGDEEVVRYTVGGEFKPHTDAHRESARRAFTVIVYLNGDCSGGDTGFPDLAYSCSPKAGRVLIFDSTQLHAGLPVTQGNKFILVYWVFFPGRTSTPEAGHEHASA